MLGKVSVQSKRFDLHSEWMSRMGMRLNFRCSQSSGDCYLDDLRAYPQASV